MRRKARGTRKGDRRVDRVGNVDLSGLREVRWCAVLVCSLSEGRGRTYLSFQQE